MKKLSFEQKQSIEKWVYTNGRPLEIAKWNLLWEKGSQDELINEMLKYQNDDGGFGNGLEADILTPESAAIPSAEAIFTAQDYNLDLTCEWAKRLFRFFELTCQKTPSYWEPVPKSLEDYPHPPWWSYHEDKAFSPNPCAVIASALILNGTSEQKTLGHKISAKCINFILNDTQYWDHDTYCLQRLFLSLKQAGSSLIDDRSATAMEKRILSCVCYDENIWLEYVAQPLDLVHSPSSPWYQLIIDGIEKNASYWIETLTEAGYWKPNFSWGVVTETSQRVIKNWVGYIAVKRVKILKAFGYVE